MSAGRSRRVGESAKPSPVGNSDCPLLLGALFDKCQGCKAPLPLDNELWDHHIESWLDGAKTIPPTSQISSVTCAKCSAITCVGCGATPTIGENNAWTSLGVINHCCDGGRKFGISLLLYQLDKEALALETSKAKPQMKTKPPPKQQSNKFAKEYSLSGVGYTSENNYPTNSDYDNLAALVDWQKEIEDEEDYLADSFESLMEEKFALFRQMGAIPPQEKENPLDSTFAKTLLLLVKFIGFHPRDEIIIFHGSQFLDQINDLARSDSVIDMTQRQELYIALFEFIRHIIREDSGLTDLVFQRRKEGRSFFESLRNTYEQAKFFLKLESKSETTRAQPEETSNNTSNGTLSKARDGLLAKLSAMKSNRLHGLMKSKGKATTEVTSSDSVKLCNSLVELYETIEKHPACPKISQPLANTDAWKQFWEENKLLFCEGVVKNHRIYKVGINSLVSSTPVRNRATTINKEIANLQTSLPEGIFMRVDETRTDVIKVLIVGVEGTPYAGGLFPFDLFLDENYPAVPPKMLFVLENVDEDGQAINPNLHALSGKVCLSLLNTWHGAASEMWQPNKSTILSVLVSVQSMILGAQVPYMNEPGVEVLGDSRPEIQEYTYNTQCKTVKHGMIHWLKKLENSDASSEDIWKDVSAAYWKHNGEKVLQTVKDWVPKNPRLEDYTPDPGWFPNFDNTNPPKRKGKQKALKGKNLIHALTLLVSPGAAVESAKLDGPLLLHLQKRTYGEERDRDDKDDATGGSPKRLKQSAMTWQYTGERKMVSVRAACEAFGVGPSNSIINSIAKLEKFVMDIYKETGIQQDLKEWGVWKE